MHVQMFREWEEALLLLRQLGSDEDFVDQYWPSDGLNFFAFVECIDLLILIIIAINFYNIEGSFVWFFGALLVPQIMCIAGK